MVDNSSLTWSKQCIHTPFNTQYLSVTWVARLPIWILLSFNVLDKFGSLPVTVLRDILTAWVSNTYTNWHNKTDDYITIKLKHTSNRIGASGMKVPLFSDTSSKISTICKRRGTNLLALNSWITPNETWVTGYTNGENISLCNVLSTVVKSTSECMNGHDAIDTVVSPLKALRSWLAKCLVYKNTSWYAKPGWNDNTSTSVPHMNWICCKVEGVVRRLFLT